MGNTFVITQHLLEFLGQIHTHTRMLYTFGHPSISGKSLFAIRVITYAKQKHLGCKKSVRPIRSSIANRYVRPKTLISFEAKKLLIKNLFHYLNDIQQFIAYFHNYDWLCHLATKLLLIGLALFLYPRCFCLAYHYFFGSINTCYYYSKQQRSTAWT